MDSDINQFAKRLNSLIDQSNKSASQISRDLGISKQVISSWRTGYRTPKRPTLFALARYFGVSIDWLTGKTDNFINYTDDYYAEDHDIDPFDALLIRHFNDADNSIQKSICKLLDISDDDMRRGGILRD